MLKNVFIILHYQNIDDTINCVESIKKLKNLNNENYKIIIVDNKSPNNTGQELKEKFEKDDTIDLLLLDKNYGFSKANNIAYKKAKTYNPTAILVLNNDILFEDREFLIKLNDICKSNRKYDIICPDIINLNGNHQNPLRDKEMTVKKAVKNIIYETIFALSMNIVGFRKILLNKRKNREEQWFKKYYNTKNNINPEDFVPFGAFIIYMNKWLETESVAFVSDTFMYEEEDMLSLYIHKKKYKMIYAEDLKVKHLEGQSTQKSNKGEYKIMKFKSKNKAKALRKYIKYYKIIKLDKE